MPITRPTAFMQNHQKSGAITTMVVVMKSDISTIEYVASTIDMQQSNKFVRPHLLSVSSINEKIDKDRKTWGTSDVTIQLLNPRYTQGSDGIKDRLSEATDPEWSGTVLDWNLVDIYLLSGSNSSSFVADGILRFAGRILATPTVTEKTITIKAISIEKEKHRILPQTLVGETYADAPAKNLLQPIPIVYGEFNQNFWGALVYTDGSFTGLGLAKALMTVETKAPKYVIADHVVDAITGGVFIDLGSGLPFNGGGAGTVNDSGHATVPGGVSYTQTFHLNDTVPDELTNYQKVMLNKANAHDNNTGTKGTLQDNTTDSIPLGIVEGYGFFGIRNDLAFRSTFWQVASGDNVPLIKVRFWDVEWEGTQAEVLGKVLDDACAFQLYYGGTSDNIATPTGSGGATVKGSLDNSFYKTLTIGDRNDATFSEEQPMALALYIKAAPEDGSPALNTTDLMHLKEVLLDVFLVLVTHPLEAWVECRGREYGSWITASGRDIDSRSPGDLIENQAHIIESILRDELGVSSSDIDIDSFDSAYEEVTPLSKRQARLNVFKKVSSEKVIREIAEQSTFAFTWTAAGKAKLIPLYSSYWSEKEVDATIPWSHIKANSLKISKTRVYCNEVDVQSRWQGEATTYRDEDTTADSSSKTNYGFRHRTARWKNIAGATKDHVADGYVFTVFGLWSQPHLQIELETLGFTNAHLEIGDAIKLDSFSCDPQIKAYAESWSGPKFCVTELQQKIDGTKIKAVELF